MLVDEKALGCASCCYHNGDVCGVCYKKIISEFEESKVKKDGESTKRSS